MDYKKLYGNLILFEQYEKNALNCIHIATDFEFVKKAQRNRLFIDSNEYYNSLDDLIHIAKEISHKPALCNIVPIAHLIWWITLHGKANRHIINDKNYYFKQNEIQTTGLLVDVI